MENENYTQSDMVARNCGPSIGAYVGRLRHDGAQGDGKLCRTAAWINVYLFAEQHGMLWVGRYASDPASHRANVGGKTHYGVCVASRSEPAQC